MVPPFCFKIPTPELQLTEIQDPEKTTVDPLFRTKMTNVRNARFVIKKGRNPNARCASNKPTTRTPQEHEHELQQWSSSQQKNSLVRLNDSLRFIGSLYVRYKKQIGSVQINGLGLGKLIICWEASF